MSLERHGVSSVAVVDPLAADGAFGHVRLRLIDLAGAQRVNECQRDHRVELQSGQRVIGVAFERKRCKRAHGAAATVRSGPEHDTAGSRPLVLKQPNAEAG